MSVEAMYTELILSHNRSGHNRRTISDATHAERGHNPNCGDDLTLMIKVQNNMIKDAAYTGSGCAISQASMSMMIDSIKGLSVDSAKIKLDLFFKMIRGGALTEVEQELLGDSFAFSELGKMPARVKCGTLGWHCLETGLERK